MLRPSMPATRLSAAAGARPERSPPLPPRCTGASSLVPLGPCLPLAPPLAHSNLLHAACLPACACREQERLRRVAPPADKPPGGVERDAAAAAAAAAAADSMAAEMAALHLENERLQFAAGLMEKTLEARAGTHVGG